MFGLTWTVLLRSAVFPGFKERFGALFASGFQYIPYFMALVYGAVRLLPQTHPYLNPANMGRFSIRHVIAEAANNLVFSKQNADQIILFFTLIFGLVLVFLQICLLAFGLVIAPAMAAMPTNFAGFFVTPNESQDLAHIMLDMVFGVPDFFNSCVQLAGTPCTNIMGQEIQRAAGAPGGDWSYQPGSFPFPIHYGLHQLFQLYNIGLTVVAVFITVYFIITVIFETAQSGTPFGKRFNKVWAPVRFVVAFGLLFPIGYGYSSSQYIVFYAAKFGSAFATNGWIIFNNTLNTSYGSAVRNLLADDSPDAQGLIAKPKAPEIGNLLQFLYTAKTCQAAERIAHGAEATLNDVKFYLVDDPLRTPQNFLEVNFGTSYDQMMAFADGNNQVIIRFGQRDEAQYGRMLGFVNATCGELTLKLTEVRTGGGGCNGGLAENCPEQGVQFLQNYYWSILKQIWFQDLINPENYPQNLVNVTQQFSESGSYDSSGNLPQATSAWKRTLQNDFTEDLQTALDAAQNLMEQSLRWEVDANLLNKGWAGAAIWYNRIAEMNGSFISAALNMPVPSRYPEVMEKVYANKRQNEERVNFKDRFNPSSVSERATQGLSETDGKIAGVLWVAFSFWQEENGSTTTQNAPTGNAAIDIINALFGTSGLFAMRENNDAHPIAQLTAAGRSLLEGALRNLTYAAVGGAGGGLAAIFDRFTGVTLSTASSFLITFAMIGITAGFTLFYIVPLLPFIYFFFAVGTWIKTVFEAMVGAPLWALAHLRIDNNGLAGKDAVTGYFLIFEIFLRPILIVFGLLASIATLSALVGVLHQVFDLVIANTAGFDSEAALSDGFGSETIALMRSAIDRFFFTVIYAIICYLLCLSSCKLIDLIPNNILRWMGQSVASFGDKQEDAGAKLVGSSIVGTQQATGAIGGGLQGLAKLGGRG